MTPRKTGIVAPNTANAAARTCGSNVPPYVEPQQKTGCPPPCAMKRPMRAMIDWSPLSGIRLEAISQARAKAPPAAAARNGPARFERLSSVPGVNGDAAWKTGVLLEVTRHVHDGMCGSRARRGAVAAVEVRRTHRERNDRAVCDRGFAGHEVDRRDDRKRPAEWPEAEEAVRVRSDDRQVEADCLRAHRDAADVLDREAPEDRSLHDAAIPRAGVDRTTRRDRVVLKAPRLRLGRPRERSGGNEGDGENERAPETNIPH